MKIAGYVGDLLYDYECVVIPGLGGFITKDKPAQVIAVTNHFKPPFREVIFNIHLKANDGLLINYVARHEELSYNEAKSRVDMFALQCRNALDAGKRIRFFGIGTLSRDAEQHIVFTQDKSINYNPDAFGLGSFISPAITRTSDEEKVLGAIKKVVPEKKPVQDTKPAPEKRKKILIATKKRTPFKSQLLFLMFVFLMMGVGYVYMHRHAMRYYWDNHAQKIPMFYTSPQLYLAKNIDLFPIRKLANYSSNWFPGLYKSDIKAETSTPHQSDISQATIIPLQSSNTLQVENPTAGETILANSSPIETPVESAKEVLKSEPVAIENKPEIAPETSPVVTPPSASSFNYFIIAGSFNNENNARKMVSQLIAKGFEAMIADTNKNGMYRVAYKGFRTAEEASIELSDLKNKHNPQAWILKK
ncbi:MAG: SPOR domain-containing protein [Bacteroidales bacterium]|jgi:hypothetical protein